jgi:hypothetical protein
MLHEGYNRKCSVEKKMLVVILKGLFAKTKPPVVKYVTLPLVIQLSSRKREEQMQRTHLPEREEDPDVME